MDLLFVFSKTRWPAHALHTQVGPKKRPKKKKKKKHDAVSKVEW
jgi:hypothetical protein